MRAIHLLREEHLYYGPFARLLLKNIIIPLVQDARWRVHSGERIDNYHRKLTLTFDCEAAVCTWIELPSGTVCLHKCIGCGLNRALTHRLGLLFQSIEKILGFLYTTLKQGFGDDYDAATESFFKVLGDIIWPDLCKIVISEFLSKAIPDHAAGLPQFEVLGDIVHKFENELVTRGMLNDSSKHLSVYCSSIDVHFSKRKHSQIMSAARSILLDDDYSTTVMGTAVPGQSI